MIRLFLAEEQQPTSASSFVVFGILIVAIIALFVWQSVSGKKKQKEAQNMVNSLKIGDRVKTIGGICGFVAEINNSENTFVLETGLEGNKCFVKFDKGAIYQTAPAQGSAYADKTEEKAEEKVEEKTEEKAEPVAEETTKKPAKKKKEINEI